MKDTLDILDTTKDHDFLKKKIDEFYQILQKIRISYTNLEGNIASKKLEHFMQYPYSIQHRFNSIFYHLDSLSGYLNQLPDILQQEDHEQGIILPSNGSEHVQNMSYIFEDIIFNLCSFIDYLGNIISKAFDQNKITTWNGLVKASSPKSKNKLNKLEFTNTIIDFHKNFVDHLFRYRSDIFHETANLLSYKYEVSVNSKNKSHKIIVYAPKKLVTSFKKMKEIQKGKKNTTLVFITFWLIKETITNANTILLSLEKAITDKRIKRKAMTYLCNPLLNTVTFLPINPFAWNCMIYAIRKRHIIL